MHLSAPSTRRSAHWHSVNLRSVSHEFLIERAPGGVKVSIPRRPSPMPELGHLDQQGRELFNTVSQSPFAQIATNYGKDMLKNSKVRVLSETRDLIHSTDFLLLLHRAAQVLFQCQQLVCAEQTARPSPPLPAEGTRRHHERVAHVSRLQSWKRQVVRKDEMEFFCPPRDDVNAPDLCMHRH